ncbi:MAG: ABC transporter ATP-binding protein [Oscillospiraceae bacterium]|nr:ABC transporter ATP-binding protein [Oscillospiraceae bacterium]
MAELKLVNVTKIFPWANSAEKEKAKENNNPQYSEEGVAAVRDFSIEVADKEFIVLVGPSGCGKSTTLRIIAGLEDPSSGDVYIGTERVNDFAPKKRDISMVFQNYALFPHMNVYDNMAFGLKMRHASKEEIDKKVREAAEILGLTEYLGRKPKALSGGQRQRVAIGRAIVREPKLFLMDEPLSNLDAKLRSQMRTEIIKLRQKLNTTFIYVTHDQTEAMTLGDRMVIMKDGIVQQIGTPQEVFNHPANIFVAGFIGTPQMNFFPARLIRRGDEYSVLLCGSIIPLSPKTSAALKEKNSPDRDITLGIRPEHIGLAEKGVSGKVELCEMMGSSHHIHATVGTEEAVMVLPSSKDHGLSSGDKIFLDFDGEKVHLFGQDGRNIL